MQVDESPTHAVWHGACFVHGVISLGPPIPTPARSRGRKPPAAPAGRSATIARSTLVAAATRVLQRRGARGLLWSQIAREAGTRSLVLQRRFEDLAQLVYECHDRSAAAMEACLLRAETSGGIGRDRLALFLRAAFAARREQGAFLPLSRAQGLPGATAKGLRERESGIRARLDRLLGRGEKDGSMLAGDREAVIELVLGTLYQPAAGRGALRRVELDAAIAELLLRALVGEALVRGLSDRAPSAPPRR